MIDVFPFRNVQITHKVMAAAQGHLGGPQPGLVGEGVEPRGSQPPPPLPQRRARHSEFTRLHNSAIVKEPQQQILL